MLPFNVGVYMLDEFIRAGGQWRTYTLNGAQGPSTRVFTSGAEPLLRTVLPYSHTRHRRLHTKKFHPFLFDSV